MREHTFRIPIKPHPKQRPQRSKHGGMFTPKETRVYEQEVARCYDGPQFEGPVEVSIILGKDFSTVTIRESDHAPSPLRGDLDNYMKSILDALNGKAFVDDKQVLVLRGVKGI